MKNRLQQFQSDGFFILENFNTAKECDDLMRRAEELTSIHTFRGRVRRA